MSYLHGQRHFPLTGQLTSEEIGTMYSVAEHDVLRNVHNNTFMSLRTYTSIPLITIEF